MESEIKHCIWGSKSFIAAFQLGKESDSSFYGEFDGIPVYRLYASTTNAILIINLTDYCYEERPTLNTTIRELTEKEVSDILESEERTRAQLQEEVYVHGFLKFRLQFTHPLSALLIMLR